MTQKILIVDDSKLARMAVNKLLGTLYPDWTSVEAANAEEALEVLAQDAPDVALVDFNMPGRDGLDLAGEFRHAIPGMPVGVISANHQQEVVRRAQDLGAVFLPKPLTGTALGQFLQDALGRLGKRQS